MKRILILSPYSKDANSFWRCMGPWSYLIKNSSDLEIDISLAMDDLGSQGLAWDSVGRFDMVFFHRPCRTDDLTVMQIAKNMNIPTWVDYDDDLFNVPSWNPTTETYNNISVQNVVAHMLATADVVTTTTTALYDKFRKVNKNVVIVPNAYRSDLYPYRAKEIPKREDIFIWRGTATHDADLLSVMEGFTQLHSKTVFLGSPSWLLLSKMKPGSYEVRGAQDNLLFNRCLWDMRPKVLLCPLLNDVFNQAKSNIAYIEALHAGAVCVAPDMPEWQRPGVITYKPGDSDSFAKAANDAIAMTEAHHYDIVNQAYNHMLELYDISRVNEIRISILKAILNKDYERNERSAFDQLVAIWALSRLKGTHMPEVSLDTLAAKGIV